MLNAPMALRAKSAVDATLDIRTIQLRRSFGEDGSSAEMSSFMSSSRSPEKIAVHSGTAEDGTTAIGSDVTRYKAVQSLVISIVRMMTLV
jgi:hypothetical protein